MTDRAPQLGAPTNVEDSDDELHVEGDDDKTIETPDELGGTGGEQAGGAG